MKGQTSMVAVVIAVVMVIFIMIFILMDVLSPDQESISLKTEYRDLYTNNLLLSMLETDTDDGKMSDLLKKSYFGSGTGFDERIDEYMLFVLNATGHTDYDWLLEVNPNNFQMAFRSWGNTLVTASPGYWDARTILTSGGNQIEVKLYIRTK